ncbi:MAG: Very-short-patch mismatch repair endonuclease (G-T specific), partial [uncultured Acetobacteraceae bacterium]
VAHPRQGHAARTRRAPPPARHGVPLPPPPPRPPRHARHRAAGAAQGHLRPRLLLARTRLRLRPAAEEPRRVLGAEDRGQPRPRRPEGGGAAPGRVVGRGRVGVPTPQAGRPRKAAGALLGRL